MTENFTVAKGSFGYNLNFALKDSAGTARNLDGYSVKLQMWAPLVPGTLLIDTAISWTDDTAGTCYYTIPAATTFATVGVYQYAVIPYIGSTVLDPALTGFITVTQYGGSYCTLEEVKSELKIDNNLNDDIIQRMIPQTKSAIDDYCDRTFDVNTTVGTKYYDGSFSPLYIDDLVSITGTGAGVFLDEDADGTYEATLATSDYLLKPANKSPKTHIVVTPYGDYGGLAANVPNGVKIIGIWGYSAVPEPVRRAAIITTCRWFKRKDSAFQDVIGTSELGTLTVYRGLDPDVKQILQPYIKVRYA